MQYESKWQENVYRQNLKMSKLHVFGDSYSTPDYCVSVPDSWWGLLAQDLEVSNVINWCWSGNNVENIAQTLFCYQNEIQRNEFIVIALPPMGRITTYNPDLADSRPLKPTKRLYNNNLECIDEWSILTQQGLVEQSVHHMSKDFVLTWDPGYAEAVALRNIGLLLKYFETNPMMVVNASVPFQPLTEWSTLRMAQDQVFDDPRVELFETYYTVNKDKHRPVDFDEWEWMGHQGAPGNLEFYNRVVQPMARRLKWL